MGITLKCAVDDDKLKANFDNFKKLKVKHIKRMIGHGKLKKTPAIVCAAGPSLKTQLSKIKGLDGDIFSVKTEKYLRDNDIIPKYDVHVDARESETKYIEPHKSTTYLISTQCTPNVFEYLKDFKVYGFNSRMSGTWHPAEIQTAGANVASQTILLALAMGYREIHLFGMDCSFDKEADTHVIWSDRRPEKPIIEVQRQKDERVFYTTPEMAGHAEELFKVLMTVLQAQGKMHIHGDGLAQNVVKDLVQKHIAHANVSEPSKQPS